MKKHLLFMGVLFAAAGMGSLTQLHGEAVDTKNTTFQQISIQGWSFSRPKFTFESEGGQDRFVGNELYYTSWNWGNGSLISAGLQVDDSPTNVVTSFPKGLDGKVETVFATGVAIGDEYMVERSQSTGEIIFEEHIPVVLDFYMEIEFSEFGSTDYYGPFNNHGLKIENVEWDGQSTTIARRLNEIGNEGFSRSGASLLMNVDGDTQYDWSPGEADGTFKSAITHTVESVH